MKRLLIALIVCVYIVTAVFSAVLPVTSTAVELDGTAPSETTAATETTETTENTETTESTEASENTEATEDTTESTESSGGEDPLPEETTPVEDEEPQGLQWMSYMDFLYEQVESVYMNPEIYVGYTAIFNDGWANFVCSDDPTVVLPRDECLSVDLEDLVDDQGNSIRVRIVEWIKDENEVLWYKVEAVEGYVLPQILEENPYILQAEYEEDFPSLLIMPVKGMFVGETVDIKNQAAEATRTVILATNTLPAFFDVIPVESNDGWVGYDLGDVSSWNDELTQEYRYVEESSVMLIPVEVSVAYETLLKAESAEEYEQIWNQLPETVRNKFTDRHLEDLNNRQEELNNVTHSGNVIYNGQTLEVSVSGRIPKDVTLSVAPVSYETVMAEGFDVSSATDLITALDIKLLNPNGTEWQPEDGERIAVSIDMASLGIEDETVVRLHHKHGDRIEKFDVFLVLDGKVTLYTNGFSIYAVERINGPRINGTELNANNNNPPTINLFVGDNVIYYCTQSANNKGTWSVTDPSGAIHYTVHSNGTLGNGGMHCPWIKIDALKATPNGDPIILEFRYGNNNRVERYYLNISSPRAAAGQKRLYLKDDVNLTGRIVATLVDDKGNELSLEGAAFTWRRSDNYMITHYAYGDNQQSINIARDHGGLVEARKDANGYLPTTYYVEALLPGEKEPLEAEYTVYYQSEFINSGFEFPKANTQTYTYFPNGWPELYWETTAPGSSRGGNYISMDIEYGEVTGVIPGGADDSGFGVEYAADHASGGTQFAELNAEAVGALYQDIITVPNETIEWEFSHAPRRQQDWMNGNNFDNKMYIIIGATENAQRLDDPDGKFNMYHIIDAADAMGVVASDGPVTVTLEYSATDKATYSVWYHDAGKPLKNNAGRDDFYSAANNYGWKEISGTYTPEQYRTRLFFVSDNKGNKDYPNFGNLIDKAKAGQYLSYLIEYYEETFIDGESVLVHKQYQWDEYGEQIMDSNGKPIRLDESGEALLYSSQSIANLDYFISTEHDYLHEILINGENYPYNIRYSGDASIYVERYHGTKTHKTVVNQTTNASGPYYTEGYSQNDYSQYDIVMQIVLRDTVVAVQKEIKFPDSVTPEQRLEIITALRETGGYKAHFKLYSDDPDYSYSADDEAVITNRDPMGYYTGYVSLGDDPELNHDYVVQETDLTDIPGLELYKVYFKTVLYSHGAASDPVERLYEVVDLSTTNVITHEFRLHDEAKIADVKVENYYREKSAMVYYKAVGNGKVALADSTEFVDVPSEKLPYYSGKSAGATIHEGLGATFVGWYLDEACTQEVPKGTSEYGVVEDDGTFKPSPNKLEGGRTFYAKFVTGTIVIERSNAEPGQSFVYHVTGTTTGGKPVDLYVTVVCNESGYGKTEVLEVLAGTYTVTEVEDWSWRYDTDAGASRTIIHNGGVETTSFSGNIDWPNWLSGLAEIAENIFKVVSS